jgi:hypothetical protein
MSALATEVARLALWQAQLGAPPIERSSADWRDAYPGRMVPAPPASAAPPAPSRVTDEEFAKMPARDRLDYVRQFDQSTMPAWRDPRAA